MSDDIDDRVKHAQEQNRHANVQSDVSIGMEGDGDSGALSKSRDMLREHNELASDASEQMLQQDDAMIDDEIRSGNEGVAEDVLNNGLEQADKQNQLPSESEGSQPESAPEQSVPEQPQPEPKGAEAQPDNAGIELLKRGAPAAAAESALQNSSGPQYKEVDHYSSEFMGVNDDGSKNYIGQRSADFEPISPESTPTTPTSEPTTEPVAPAPAPTSEPDVNGRSDYLMRQSERIEQHANIADATANKGDRNMMRQGVLHQMDKRTLVHDTGMVSRLQGRAKTNMLTHNNKLAADIRDSARTQSKLTAIYSKTHKNAGEAYRKANKLRQAAQQLKLQHAPKPVTPGPVKPNPNPVDPNKPKSVEPKKLEPKKDNPQTESPKEDFGPHIPQKLGTPKTFKKPVPKPKPKSKPKPKDKSAPKHGKSDKEKADEIFNETANSLNPLWSTILKPQIIVPSIVAPFAGHKASFESKDKSDAKSNARLAALNERLDDGRRASHHASNGVSYC